MPKPTPQEILSAHMREIGKRGGSAGTDRQRAAQKLAAEETNRNRRRLARAQKLSRRAL